MSADSSAVAAARNPIEVFDGSRPVSLAAPRMDANGGYST
jgi:hypothetical protein